MISAKKLKKFETFAPISAFAAKRWRRNSLLLRRRYDTDRFFESGALLLKP
jgi:hypothetical protein